MSTYWDRAIQRLAAGERITVRPRGHSMEPRIHDGQEVELAPVDMADLVIGDVVLARVRGRVYLHRVSALQAGRAQIANNRGRVNGWTTQVYGKAAT